MNNLTKSFATLVKFNNGFFKSEKQANFLLSKCESNVFYGESSNVYNNITRNEYHCDQTGIIKVVKYSQTKKTLKTVWNRKADQEFKKDLNKKLVRIKASNKMNSLQKRITQLEYIKSTLSTKIIDLVMTGNDINDLKNTKLFLVKKSVDQHVVLLECKWKEADQKWENA